MECENLLKVKSTEAPMLSPYLPCSSRQKHLLAIVGNNYFDLGIRDRCKLSVCLLLHYTLSCLTLSSGTSAVKHFLVAANPKYSQTGECDLFKACQTALLRYFFPRKCASLAGES